MLLVCAGWVGGLRFEGSMRNFVDGGRGWGIRG